MIRQPWLKLLRLAGGRARHQVPRIGLALGGGFARGIAHVGVLRVFEQNKIPVDFVAGVSAGSMVAAAYASGTTPDEIEKIARCMTLKDVARWTISRFGLAESERMVAFLHRLLKTTRFDEMRIPLAVVASDLTRGEPVVFRDKGDVITPIRASCAYPGLFLPIHDGDRCLVDGGITMESPVLPLRAMGATHVIAVHLPAPAVRPDLDSVFSLVNRCFQVMQNRMTANWRPHANLLIEPVVSDVRWDGFTDCGKLIEAGEKAALAAIPAIRTWLDAAGELTSAATHSPAAVVA